MKTFRTERITDNGRNVTRFHGQVPCYAMNVQGIVVAERVAADLINRSAWFQVEPLPEDEYEIAVKEENRTLLIELCAINQDDS